MNSPQIQIQTTRGILDIQTTKPIQEIEQPRASISMEQPAAILDISTTRSQLSIDTTEARAEIDLKSIARRISENAQRSKQVALEGIGRRASEGQQLMNIQNGGNMIVELAKRNGTPPPAPLGIRFIGNKSGVKMSFQPGTANIQFTPQKVNTNVQVNKPIHHYTPGKVTGEMNPYPSIQIDVKW